MVFVAVSVPKLARSEHSFYRASLEGHANNVHCVAAAVNAVFGALFTVCSAGAVPGVNSDPASVAGVGSDIEDRMKEFLAVSYRYQFLNQQPPISSPIIIIVAQKKT